MVNSSYNVICSIIKKIRGVPLTDLPDNWIVIMQTFDQRQRMDKEGLQIAEQLLKETSYYLRLIGSLEGDDSPNYLVASNTIAHNALYIIKPVVDSVCVKASIAKFKLHNQLDLFNRILECQIVLQQIEKLVMTDIVKERMNEMKPRLAKAEKQMNIFLIPPST